MCNITMHATCQRLPITTTLLPCPYLEDLSLLESAENIYDPICVKIPDTHRKTLIEGSNWNVIELSLNNFNYHIISKSKNKR